MYFSFWAENWLVGGKSGYYPKKKNNNIQNKIKEQYFKLLYLFSVCVSLQIKPQLYF